MSDFNFTRRGFIRAGAVGGISLYLAPLALDAGKSQAAIPELVGRDATGALKPRFRTDGIAKVTGSKIYGRDLRAVDMEGWPDDQGYAYIVRATRVNQVFTGIDLSSLSESAQPDKVITSADLQRDGVQLPPFYGENMLLGEGSVAQYYGHAVAVLLYGDFPSFKAAKQAMEFSDSVLKYGDTVNPADNVRDPYASWRIIRVEGAKPGDPDIHSPLHDGVFFPTYKAHKAFWPQKTDQGGSVSERGMYHAQQIASDIEKSGWYVQEKEYRTQIIEPMMLEAEAANGWFDRESRALHMVITSQSPGDFLRMASEMLSKGAFSSKIKHLVVHSAFVGGGFGAKDHSIFPYYGMLAAIYAGGPMRLANDRFQQFQNGLKRHPFVMRNRIAIDRNSLKLQAMTADMDLDGGGRSNFSPSVSMVGASAAQGIYYLPRNDLAAVAYPSANPTSGSMRGYGTLQTMSATESMMNEAAEDLGVDPIELRKINAMVTGQRNSQGAIPVGEIRYGELLDLAGKHEIWLNRDSKKKAFEANNPGKRYGVGFGIVTKDYGTGAAAPNAALRLLEDGKLELVVEYIEMGTGSQTGQAVAIAEYLGGMADNVVLGETRLWSALQQFDTDDPYLISQERQDEMAADPRWTPVKEMASSASMSSFFQTHATQAAARIIYRHGVWPAAVEIWGQEHSNAGRVAPNQLDPDDGEWSKAGLSAGGFPPLDLPRLARKCHEMGLVTGAMVHAFNRWAWAEADFVVLGKAETLPIDALAVQYGTGADADRRGLMTSEGYHLLDRSNMQYPATGMNNAMVTYYTPCATLAEIAISESDGSVEILRTHTWLEAGRVLVKELVEGQIQGGLAMGIGHALYEYIPPLDKGAGNGTWNLGSYKVPMAQHVGVWHSESTILPPLTDSDPAKGCAEVVMIPIVAALVEAVYQATGTRFYELPMSAERIKGALS
jgi:CO/xanthine dehydrogenase Mo-binding subunit